MNKYRTCCVIGRSSFRPSEEEVKNLDDLFEFLIVKGGVETFYFGGPGSFDSFCLKIVTEKKKKYPHILAVYVANDYRDFKNPYRHTNLLDEYDEVEFFDLEFAHWKSSLYYRNKEMIKNSDYAVFYTLIDEKSGSYKAFKFAKTKFKHLYGTISTTEPNILLGCLRRN